MNSTKADSWQEMQSRRLIQLLCKPRPEDKNAELCVENTEEALRQNLFTGLKHILLSEVTNEKRRNKKETT